MKNLLFLTFLITTTFSIAVAQEKERLSLDHYQDFESVGGPQISPDGKMVLYTRGWINLMEDRRESELWIMNSDGSQNRFFADGSSGRWSPDGKKILFTRSGEPTGRQIFVKFVNVEGEPSQITRLSESPSNISWSPDGKMIAFQMHVPQNDSWRIDIPAKPEGAKWTAPPAVIDDVRYRRDRVGYFEPGYTHIFVISAEGGRARQVTSGDWHHGGSFTWTADSEEIVFSSLRVPDPDYEYRQSNLYKVNVRSGEITQLTDREGSESNPVMSPDGRSVIFVGSEWTPNFYHKRMLFAMNADGSNVRPLTTDMDRSNLSGMEWAADNSGVYFNVRETGHSNIYFVSTDGNVRKVTEGEHILSMSNTSNNGIAVGTRTSPQQPGDVVSVNLSDGSITQLTHVNDDIFDYVELGEVEEIWYKSTDGTDIQGWIVKPPDFDPTKKYPMILRIHGGPHSMYHVGFNMNFQLHAAKDQVVLYTNPRGSTGYGYDFANAIQNAYPGNDYDDLMRGVDEVISRGYIDEDRMYVYGGSGGGVLTSWIVGHTDRFAAASVNYPVVDWLSFVGTTDGIGWYRNFEKYPWEDPSEHLRRSPLMYVGNVTTPTMLMTGVKDLRTPISQTEEYYQALQINKVPSVMLRFNDEFHGTGSKPSNYLRTFGYLSGWFAKYGAEDHLKEKVVKP